VPYEMIESFSTFSIRNGHVHALTRSLPSLSAHRTQNSGVRGPEYAFASLDFCYLLTLRALAHLRLSCALPLPPFLQPRCSLSSRHTLASSIHTATRSRLPSVRQPRPTSSLIFGRARSPARSHAVLFWRTDQCGGLPGNAQSAVSCGCCSRDLNSSGWQASLSSERATGEVKGTWTTAP